MSFVSLPPSIPLNAHEDGLGNYTARAYPLKEVSPPKIDGILNDEAWKKASPVSGFVWKDFPEKVASEETVCYIVYDRYHLYVGFRCYDSEPENIVNRISRRGNAFDSDVISFFIDPYHDHRTGYKFVCTPGGVKDDNYRYDDSKADSSWEGVWWAEGNIDDLGWTAEFKIPFSNFRFTDTEKQVWGINFERFIRRKRETDAWKPLGSDGGYWTRMSALGHLIGLEGIQSSEHVEVYPYFMGGTTESQGKGVKGRSDLGIDFQYRLTNQFRLSSMVNPDFAQVEADQLEINLTRFPTRFAEKRPFFIEGNSIFATPLELYYSRRIGNRGDILWGTNVTGKVGNYTLGFISSQTGDWNYFGLQDETETKERALFTILRTKRDILEKSNIGILYAGKEMMDENQRVLGLDANVEVGENAFFIGQIAQSWNALSKLEPARAYLLTFTRKTDRFNTEVSMDRMEPEFSANQTGFLQKELYRGWQGIGTKLEYTPRPSVLGLEKLFIGTQGHLFQGLYTDDYFLDLALKNPNLKISPFFDPDILLWSNIMWVQMRFRESVLEQFGVMFSYSKESELTDFFWAKTGSIFLRTDTAKRIFTTLQLNMGDFYNFSQKYVGKQSGFNLSGTLRPKNNLTFELTTGYAQTSNPDGETDGKFLANSFRVTYLLTRDLFCRLFAQALWNRMYYDQREISLKYLISFLVGWEYSPKSHFFIAYNEDWDTSADRLRFSDRVIVAKISYLWNL
ncbi:MAG: DUF5916 domain-containing protein [Candidatus Poribacteria bacterium]|nr:DUF5916 domain-containing protein [Candidatus Poribacteria bacterium]